METKIKIKEASEKNGWLNIKTTDGKEISVFLEKCPKIKEQLKDYTPILDGEKEIDISLVEKNGKTYGWDLKEKNGIGGGGGFKRTMAGNESFALSYAKDLACANITAGKDIKANQIIEVAEAFYVWLQSKKGFNNG